MNTRSLLVRLLLITFALISLSYSRIILADAPSPAGTWLSYDGNDNPRNYIKITVSGNQLTGKIVKLMPVNGKMPDPICDACKGERHGKPLLGMTILYGLKNQNGVWTGGHIYDVDSGRAFDCEITPSANGKLLGVHAYVFSRAIGRTINWERIQ